MFLSNNVCRLMAILAVGFLAGCSRDTGEKIRYDMEKLVYAAQRAAEKIDVQPELTTSADSLQLKNAFQAVLDFYYDKRDREPVQKDEVSRHQMDKMAVSAQIQLARYFISQRQADSVMAAYRRIGTEIPAGRDDLAGARLALALTYRSLGQFDSVLVLYDTIITTYYPPVDSLDRVSTDILSLPVDKILIARNQDDQARARAFSDQALVYYERLRNENPGSPLERAATIFCSRVHAMNEEWDEAIDQLEQVKDSTGQVDLHAQMLIANIYNDSKKDANQAVKLYRAILDRQPDSTVVGEALLRLGATLCLKKDYEEGRKVLADLKKKFEPYPRLMARAQLFYAQAFEHENRWDRALSEYQWLMENHPYTEEAFRAALHIPEHFAAQKDEKMATIWFDRAVQFYQDAAERQRNQPIAVAAHMFLADTYVRTEQWDKAIEAYEQLYALAPKSRTGAMALFSAGRVAYRELGDSARAQTYIDRLKAEFGSADSTAIIEEEAPDLDIKSLQ